MDKHKQRIGQAGKVLKQIGKRAVRAKKEGRGMRLSFEDVNILDAYRGFCEMAEITDETIQYIINNYT